MRKYRNYSDDDIVIAVKESSSIAQVLRKLNLIQAGGNFLTIKLNISRLNLDISHWKQSGWNKGLHLKATSAYRSNFAIKRKLINERGHKCEKCDSTHWLKNLIPLKLHHIDGNSTNNNDSNLLLYCPNCHSTTSNYRRRKDFLA